MDVRDSLERLNSEAAKVFPNDTPNIKMQKTGADVTGLPKDAPLLILSVRHIGGC
jgi:hypothetical protein